jgi:hypothetical protein
MQAKMFQKKPFAAIHEILAHTAIALSQPPRRFLHKLPFSHIQEYFHAHTPTRLRVRTKTQRPYFLQEEFSLHFDRTLSFGQEIL